MKYFIVLCLFSLSVNGFSKEYKNLDDSVVFSGRVSKINSLAKLLRLKIYFENAKFLSKNNRIEIWNPTYPKNKCLTYLEGRTSEYLLVRVPKYQKCRSSIYFAAGSYLHMYSPDLENSLSTAKELQEVLNKKRTALAARLKRYKKTMNGFIEKIDVTNKRYEILRQKLELEWQKEISNLEEDKSKSYALYQKTQTKLHELDYKAQQYRVRDQNLIEDRWSLDPKLYYKK